MKTFVAIIDIRDICSVEMTPVRECQVFTLKQGLRVIATPEIINNYWARKVYLLVC